MTTARVASRCLAVAGGLALDRALGEPPNIAHPVVWFGNAMNRVESRVWKDDRSSGLAYTCVGVGLGALAGNVARSTTLVVALSCAGRQLRTAAERIGRAAESGDVIEARNQLPWLVGRDPSELDESGIAAAVIESLAENSVDAVVAPVFWALVAGAPGAAAYRAINTMDAMVGHRTERFANFGWAAARLDDVANYLPARIFALLLAAQDPRRAPTMYSTVRRDAPAHPSPNGGVAETAMASLLGVQVGGPLRYGSRHEDRPTLGNGPRPEPSDIPHAIDSANGAELIMLAALALAWLTHHFRSKP